MVREKALTEWIMEEHRRFPTATGDFTALLNHIRLACKRISFLVGRGALGHTEAAGSAAQGRASLEHAAHDLFVRTSEFGGHLAGMFAEGMAAPYAIPAGYPRGKYLLVFDPLDGAANLDVNVTAGSTFAVLRARGGTAEPAPQDFLQPGTEQLCAGYAIYGPTTMLVLTVGRGTHGFTLDREFGEFILTHPDLRIPPETREFGINASNERFWEPPVRRYVAECVAGRSGPRGVDFTMRWTASVVAEVHRVLVRGGLLMAPRDLRDPARPGRLRALYEANPLALLVEQAGGAASTGRGRLLEVVPADLHERVPVFLGSREEVERIEQYHREHDAGLDQPFSSPLFNERSLFVQA